jgi:DNA polymerase III epsilon subunit-like protein
LAFVRSRQAPGKPVLWVAHNAKQFDARFLAQEFDRCSAPLPADWLFFDTLLLAKKMVKAEGKYSHSKSFACEDTVYFGVNLI